MSLVQQAIVARCLLVVALEGADGVSRGGADGQEHEGEGEEEGSDGAAAAVDESLATRAQVRALSLNQGRRPGESQHLARYFCVGGAGAR